jgi:hypothetical protein
MDVKLPRSPSRRAWSSRPSTLTTPSIGFACASVNGDRVRLTIFRFSPKYDLEEALLRAEAAPAHGGASG